MKRQTRSHCPLNCALEFFGDQWSLLIVRELLFKGSRSFGQLLAMQEGISTGTLTNRIATLQSKGIIDRRTRSDDKRAVEYRLTPKGKGLEPILVEMVLWVADNEMPDLPEGAVEKLRKTRVLGPPGG